MQASYIRLLRSHCAISSRKSGSRISAPSLVACAWRDFISASAKTPNFLAGIIKTKLIQQHYQINTDQQGPIGMVGIVFAFVTL
jgi:hypothetical protein